MFWKTVTPFFSNKSNVTNKIVLTEGKATVI